VYDWALENIEGLSEVSQNQWVDHKGKTMQRFGCQLVTIDFIVHPWPNEYWRRGKKFKYKAL